MRDDFDSKCNSQDELGYAAVTNTPSLSVSQSSSGLLFAPALCPLSVDYSLYSMLSFSLWTQVGRAIAIWNVAPWKREQRGLEGS